MRREAFKHGHTRTPTRTRPPLGTMRHPSRVYALIHSPKYIPQESPLFHSQSSPPGGIYIFRKGIANVRICV